MLDEYPRVACLRYQVTSAENYRLADNVTHEGNVGDFRARITRQVAEFMPTRRFASENLAREALDPLLRAWEIDAALKHAPGVIEFRFHSSTVHEKRLSPGQLEGVCMMMFGGTVRPHVTLNSVPEPPENFAADDMVVALSAFYMQTRQTPAVLLHMAYAMTTCLEHYLVDLPGAARALGISRGVLVKVRDLASNRGEGAQVRKFGRNTLPTPLTNAERDWLERITKLIVERAGAVAAGVTGLPEINMITHPLR